MKKLLSGISFILIGIVFSSCTASQSSESQTYPEFIGCPPIADCSIGVCGTRPINLRSRATPGVPVNNAIRIQGTSPGPYYLNKIMVQSDGLQYSCQYSTQQVTIPTFPNISIIQWNLLRDSETIRMNEFYIPTANFKPNRECDNNGEFPLNASNCKVGLRTQFIDPRP